MTSNQLENRQHVSRAFRFSAINQIVNRIATFGSGVIIMRILSPGDVGTYAAASAIVVFTTAFNDFSMNPAVIQWKGRVSRAARSGASIALLGSLFFFGIVYAIAPYFGDWLNDEKLPSVLRLLSFAIIIDGVGTIPLALLTRKMRQKRILAIETFSLITQIVLTIILATKGLGANALVWGMLISNGLSAGLMLLSAPEAGIPGFHLETIKSLLNYSLPLALANVFRTGTMYADNIVVGAMQSTTQLGYYQLGYNGGNLPENTIGATVGRVSFAWFSEIRENQQHRIKAFHDLTLGLVATTLPFVVFLSVMSDDIVHVLYGEKWLPAVKIVRILAFLGGIRVFLNFFADIFAAIGEPILELRMFVIWLSALVPSLILGAYFGGITGVALAHVFVAVVLIMPIVFRNLARHDFPVLITAQNSIIFVLGALAQATTSYALSRFISQPFLSLVISGGAGGLIFILVTFRSLNNIKKTFTRADHGFDQALLDS